MTGFSAVIGSWNTIAMRAPRSARSRAALAASTFSPCTSMRPPEGTSDGGKRPIAACAITDFPEPDSPSRHTTWPGMTSNEMASTACARSAPAGRSMRRSRTTRQGESPDGGVGCVMFMVSLRAG